MIRILFGSGQHVLESHVNFILSVVFTGESENSVQ